MVLMGVNHGVAQPSVNSLSLTGQQHD